MDCSKAQSMIEPFLRNNLADAEKENFITHVRSCKECHDELEVYHIVYSVVDQFDNDTESENIDYQATLEEKLAQTQGGVRRRRTIRQALTTVAVMAVAALVILIVLQILGVMEPWLPFSRG